MLGNVFTSVCHSVHEGCEGFPACITGHMIGGSASRKGLGGIRIEKGWADLPHHADKWDTAGYGQQAGDTHPTGILSCFEC